MKAAEEWSVELLNLSEKQGGIDSEQCLIPTVKQIQLDAWKQGMNDAIDIAQEGEKEYTRLLMRSHALACNDVKSNLREAQQNKQSL